jgi:hydrophobe/amphiphile efflux-1 (HAE1) family protein
MNVSEPAIRRPIGTTLLAIGLFLVGAVAYAFLPVASMPTVDFPTISVSASRPGADPEIMAATVAAPLERRLGEIPGVTEMTSRSSLGTTRILLQFDLSRSIDGAARDVQSAINAAQTDLPTDLQSQPTFRKSNPNTVPIMILALTSSTKQATQLYDIADTVVAQRLSQVDGVSEVTVNGAEQPAIRVRVNPIALASMGLSMEDVRTAIANTNAQGPLGVFDGNGRAVTIGTNDQLRVASQYDPLVVRTTNGTVVRLSAIASIEPGTRNSRSFGWYNRQPSVLLVINKTLDSNVIETANRVRTIIPDIKRFIPSDIDISVVSDRTQMIRASVSDMQMTLLAAIGLVMFVVFLFLRRIAATAAAGITVPLALAGTCALMWCVGFSIDNLSLLALACSVGFVVDDAIVMIENGFRNLEKGMPPIKSALEGARQIGFTVVAISISLIAAFIPLLFMSGVVGRVFREFSVTLAFAVAVSTVVSLTLTPMICAHFIKKPPSKTATRLDRGMEWATGWLVARYESSLRIVLQHHLLTLIVLAGVMALTGVLYYKANKSYFPTDDTGLIYGGTVAPSDTSFETMFELQQRAAEIVLADPAVAGVGSSIGQSSFNASSNRGQFFINLKPPSERSETTWDVINRLRPQLQKIPGLNTFFWVPQDVQTGARGGDGSYQYTIWGPDYQEMAQWAPRVYDALRVLPELADVSTDRERSGLQVNVLSDRVAAARMGVRIQDIDTALNNAFGQRQIALLYSPRNQYRVILEIDPQFQRDPSDLSRVYVPGANGVQVPLSAVTTIRRGLQPLVVNHQGQYPSATISFGLAEDVSIDEATSAVDKAIAALHIPETLHAEFQGDARAYRQTIGAQPLLIVAALLAVYIVLGVLYESLAHPLTIISTLPSAGLGALLALQIFQTDLSLIAFIGIILLIGIVKKNGIMMVDFALEGERKHKLTPDQAIFEACRERFRPIMMTTLAAFLGALPLVIASGPGSELRRPLGITIVGGLIVSQALTLYTTPVIYLLLDRLHRRLWGRSPAHREPGTLLKNAVRAFKS